MKKLLAMVLTAVVLFAAAASAVEGDSGEAKSFDVIVIGAGGGGLAAASRLSQDGMKVLLIEQHTKVGGYMTNFQRGPYTFEVSLHAMDGLDPDGMNIPAFKRLGILDKVKPIKIDPMYRAVYPDFTLDVPADAGAYQARLKELFPHEAKNIDLLFKEMRKLNEAARAMTGLIGGDPKASLKTIAFKPWVMNPVIKYYNKTLDEMLDDFTDDQKLIAVFTQLAGFAGGEPDTIPALFFGVMWTSYHFGGYYYFEGGSQSVSNALARVIRENGGKIMLGTLVTKIIIEDGRATGVETSGGDKFDCRYVVSNANAPATFFELVGEEHLPADYVARIKSMKVGLSTFVVYMGVDKDYSDCFQGGPHEVMVNVGYDQAENFRYMREGEADKFSYAVVNYSMVDKTAAPPGKNVICITAIMPYDHLGDWRESESYEAYRELKEEIAMVLVKRAESLLPGLSEHIEVMEVGTPRTMEHFTLNPGGSIFGWDNTMDQSLLKRLPQKTPIENLYLAGAWTFPGGGQSAVLSSGLSAAAMIVKADKKK